MAALDEQGIYGQIERVAGTSSGAIAAVMVSLGYTPQEIKTAMLDLDFSKIPDGATWLGLGRLWARFGWHKGEYFLQHMRKVIEKKTGNGRATFAELHVRGCRELRVIGTDLCARCVKVFSYHETPDAEVADAIRISMSIPLFFAAPKVGEQIFTDGGIMWNFPIEIFDDGPHGGAQTIGFFPRRGSEGQEISVGSLRGFIEALFATLLQAQEVILENNPLNRGRTVPIDDLGFKPSDFKIQRESKELLMKQGFESTQKFLSDYSKQWWPPKPNLSVPGR
jgi:NTE family protein